MNLGFALSYAVESVSLGIYYIVIAFIICRQIGHKLTSFIGTVVGSLLIFLSSFCDNYVVFCILWGFSGGIVSGMIGIPAIMACKGHYPKNIGFITSLGFSAYALGPTVFGLIFTALVNPDNLPPYQIQEKNLEVSYFGPDVYNKVPETLRYLALMLFLTSTLGICMIFPKKYELENKKSRLGFKDIIRDKNFWFLTCNFMLLYAPYPYIFTNYKSIGINKIKNDHFFAYLGSAGFLAGCLARIGWGFLVDKYGWRKNAIFSNIVQIILMSTAYYTIEYDFLYAVWVVLLFSYGSGVYLVLLMGITALYPNDEWVLSYAAIGSNIIVVLEYFIQLGITPIIGYQFTFMIIVAFLVTNLGFLYYLPNKAIKNRLEFMLLKHEQK